MLNAYKFIKVEKTKSNNPLGSVFGVFVTVPRFVYIKLGKISSNEQNKKHI